jgi:hypothetical protein
MRRMATVWLVLALGLCSTGCTPKLVGPTEAGYFFSLRASDRTIWLQPSNQRPLAGYPTTSILTVQVQDARGHSVDGVPVRFGVEPGWSQRATVSPQHTVTRSGKAQATLQVFDMGVVSVQAQVGDMTEAVSIAVRPPYTIHAPSGS